MVLQQCAVAARLGRTGFAALRHSLGLGGLLSTGVLGSSQTPPSIPSFPSRDTCPLPVASGRGLHGDASPSQAGPRKSPPPPPPRGGPREAQSLEIFDG